MRLFPGVNVHLGPYLIPNVFFPAMLMPLLLFGTLYLYPFLEQLFTFDFETHNVLRVPAQQPFNTALGCGVLMALLVLLFGGGDDVIAVATNTSVVTIRILLRILFFVAPVVAAAVVYGLCKRRNNRHAAEKLEKEPAMNPSEPISELQE